MLRRFDLEAHRGRHPFLLSGGQKRRLSVGTALIAGAPVLALDEPTFGQDRARASELLGILRQLNEEGTTVLIVTHDLQLVADTATRVAVMQEGRLLGVGPTAEVLAGPLIEAAGLRHPPLARATRSLVRHPEWQTVTRMSQLPLADRTDRTVA
jgi:energy-coupling factor transport system ATP-binding protein